jgi:putative acetyltransferase
MPELLTPSTAQEWDAVRRLMREYAGQLGVDLCFQNFESELAGLPGPYQAPRGALLTLHADGDLAGCCAVRPLDNTDHANACEMKRLFVRRPYRGMGYGRMLAEAILDTARQNGYACVLLDTLSDMETARALYQDLGFAEIPPYYYNPTAGSHYLKVKL